MQYKGREKAAKVVEFVAKWLNLCLSTVSLIALNYFSSFFNFLIELVARLVVVKRGFTCFVICFYVAFTGDGRIIRIINYEDKEMSERVLLNLKTSQPFEDVLVDLGQVVKIKSASQLYTR